MKPQSSLSILLLLLILCHTAWGSSAKGNHRGASAEQLTQPPEVDVFSLDLQGNLPGPIRQALEIIKNVQTLPACNKIATGALMNSCSSLEGTISRDEANLTVGSDLFVEEEVDIYAARLAVCELTGADTKISKECLPFVPTDRPTRKRSIRGFWSTGEKPEPSKAQQYYQHITLADLKQCRSALGATPQSWTSYSNNRQNAAVLCRGMRSEIEKDQQIHLAKILSGVSAGAVESLYDAAQMFREVKIAFQDMAKHMPAFHQDLAMSEKERETTRQLWNELQQFMNDASNNMQGLNHELLKGHEGAHALVASIDNVSNRIEQWNAEMDGSLSVHQNRVNQASGGIEALAQSLLDAQSLVQEVLVNNVESASREIALLPGVANEHIDRLILTVNKQIAQRDEAMETFAAQQDAMLNGFLDRWRVLDRLGTSLYETLGNAMSIAQQFASIFGIGVAVVFCVVHFALNLFTSLRLDIHLSLSGLITFGLWITDVPKLSTLWIVSLIQTPPSVADTPAALQNPLVGVLILAIIGVGAVVVKLLRNFWSARTQISGSEDQSNLLDTKGRGGLPI